MVTRSLFNCAYSAVNDSETASATLIKVNRFDSSHLFGWPVVAGDVFPQDGKSAPREQQGGGCCDE